MGHATRDAAIADDFGDVRARFVTGGAAAGFLARQGLDVDDVYDPPDFDVRGGSLRAPLRWLWRYYRYYTNCKRIAARIIDEHRPKLVVSDEDFASLAVAQRRGIPNVLITDILETRFARGAAGLVEKRMNRSMKDIMKKCDMIILPEEGDDEGNIRRVGPIVRGIRSGRDELRKKFSLDKKTVLVSVGGTSAGRFLLDSIPGIMLELTPENDIVIVSGPSIDAEIAGARNLGTVDDLHELICASDVIVSLAGKSTIDESRAYGTPGVFIPIGGHFEQEENARDEGFSHSDLENLTGIIRQKLCQKRCPVAAGGAQKSSEILKKFLA